MSDYSTNNRQAPKGERNRLKALWAERDRRYTIRRSGDFGPRDLGEWVTSLVRRWRAAEAMEIGDLDLEAEAKRWPYR